MSRRKADHVAAVRSFNRFYTHRIGVLEDGLLRSPFSLTEVRVLFELAHEPAMTATELGRRLGLDPGYLSRILQRFLRRGLLGRAVSPTDRREYYLRLTPAGQAAFAPLDRAASRDISRMLRRLDEQARDRLLEAMHTIMHLLADQPDA